MLYVRIELWPGGDRERASLLQELVIANDGTGNQLVGNYRGRLSHATTFKGNGFENPRLPKAAETYKEGRVNAFPRRWSPSRLVAKMLASMGER